MHECLRGICLLLVLGVAGCGSVNVESSNTIILPNYYSENMVFQRGKSINVTGSVRSANESSTSAGASVTVTFSKSSSTYQGTASIANNGTFSAAVKGVPPSMQPYALTFAVHGQVTKTIRNVYVGDVFLAAGQSNMELNYDQYYRGDSAFATNVQGKFNAQDLPTFVDDSNIHFLIADRKTGTTTLPLRSFNEHRWLKATASNSEYLGYLPQLFASHLRTTNHNVPIGIIQIAWGGTDISRHIKGGDIYKNHVLPLKGFNIAGVLWYQGEDDAEALESSLQYESRFTSLIADYRSLFGNSALPFLYVQLARYGGYSYVPIVRQAQLAALSSPELKHTNLAMTVALDTDKGTNAVIHPLGKDVLAARMAAQWVAMSKSVAVPSGPIVESAVPYVGYAGAVSTVELNFKGSTGKGLRAAAPDYHLNSAAVGGTGEDNNATSGSNGAADSAESDSSTPADSTSTKTQTSLLAGFEAAGTDGIYYPATATIQGDHVLVQSPSVSNITQVRYWWASNPACTNLLYNSQDLPASPFTIAITAR